MSFTIKVESYNESSSWNEVFRVLGVRRYQLLSVELGLPVEVSKAPDALVRASLYYWEAVWQGDARLAMPIQAGESPDDYLAKFSLSLLERLEGTFDIINKEYSEEIGKQIYNWAGRHFVDDAQISQWYETGRLLSRLADIPPHQLASAFSGQVTSSIMEQSVLIAQANLGYEAEEFFLNRLKEMEAISLAPIEKQILKLEFVSEEDDPEADLELDLRLIMRQERVIRTEIKLSTLLGQNMYSKLLRWLAARSIDMDN